jgi:galactokinase
MLDEVKSQISETIYRRCRFVIEENGRVTRACKLLNEGNIEEFGKLIYLSHNGLSQMYEVSCKELDFLVTQTESMDYVLGSRMMGGGFGGCTINLIRNKLYDNFIATARERFKQQFGIDCKPIPVVIGAGAKMI